MKIARSLLFFNLVKLLDKYKIPNTELANVLGLSPATLSQKMMGNTDWKISEMITTQNYIQELTGEKLTLDYLFKKE